MICLRGLPPCGGSGLKYFRNDTSGGFPWSPSMRREWIEIVLNIPFAFARSVSLHAEGVD